MVPVQRLQRFAVPLDLVDGAGDQRTRAGAFGLVCDPVAAVADTVGIAMHVDRPPNVLDMQQRTLVPIVIDSDGSLAKAFGGIGLTPSLILVKEGKILLHQEGRLDYDAINATILIQ